MLQKSGAQDSWRVLRDMRDQSYSNTIGEMWDESGDWPDLMFEYIKSQPTRPLR